MHAGLPIGSIRGLGHQYATQTAEVCGGDTVAHFADKITSVLTSSTAPALAGFEFIVGKCAVNPRAGQMTETAYVIPKYNTFVAHALIGTLEQCLLTPSQFPSVVRVPNMVDIIAAMRTMLPEVRERRKRATVSTVTTAVGGHL